MTRLKKRRSDGYNRGIRDRNGDLWEVELGRSGGGRSAPSENRGKVVFCRKPDGFAFSMEIPAGETLADYDDPSLVDIIERRLRDGDAAREAS